MLRKKQRPTIYPSAFPDIRQSKISKGNGITLFGTAVMMVAFVCFYLLVQIFILGHQASSLQLGIDSVSDSVAVHMATEGQDYGDAIAKTNEVSGTIRDYTGVNLGDVSLDADQLDQNIVSVSAASNVMQYNLSRSASTYLKKADCGLCIVLGWDHALPQRKCRGHPVLEI